MTTAAVLPVLAGEHPLDPAAIDLFAAEGHAVVRGLATPAEAAAFRPAIRSAAERFNTERRPMEARDTYGRAFLQVMNLWHRDAAVRQFSCAARFAQVAARLMGVRGVRMYHDQALFKEAGGGRTPWHQDQYYWPVDTDRMVTMWMPLIDVPPEIGSMRFAAGTHRMGHLAAHDISDVSDAFFSRLVEERGLRVVTHGGLRAGDTTWHAGWTLHAAAANPTRVMREVMTIIYMADGARVAEPTNPDQSVDLERWMPGLAPGDLVASELNPLLYSEP